MNLRRMRFRACWSPMVYLNLNFKWEWRILWIDFVPYVGLNRNLTVLELLTSLSESTCCHHFCVSKRGANRTGYFRLCRSSCNHRSQRPSRSGIGMIMAEDCYCNHCQPDSSRIRHFPLKNEKKKKTCYRIASMLINFACVKCQCLHKGINRLSIDAPSYAFDWRFFHVSFVCNGVSIYARLYRPSCCELWRQHKTHVARVFNKNATWCCYSIKK